MSIVAGFKADHGLVLCADTQETVGVSKRSIPKLRIEPQGELGEFDNSRGHEALVVAFCGATNDGAYMDMLIDKAWDAAKDSRSLQEACNRIEQLIKSVHREFSQIYQPGFMPDTDLIYGVKMQGDSRLFYARGPAVNEKDTYTSGGVGIYMADFLTARMWQPVMTIRQCIILAAYILFQTKKHVEGCGGGSDVAVLRNSGPSGRVNTGDVECISNVIERSESLVGEIILHCADFNESREDFIINTRKVLEFLGTTRKFDQDKWQTARKEFETIFGRPLLDEDGVIIRDELNEPGSTEGTCVED